jgi:hypothetical protein
VTEKLHASADVLQRTVVIAPVSGTVFDVKFKTVGGGVQSTTAWRHSSPQFLHEIAAAVEGFWPKPVLDHNTSADQIYWPRAPARGALRFPAILLDDTCQYL